MDKVSYALGIGIGRQLASMGAESLNIDDFAQAVKDAIAGKLQLGEQELSGDGVFKSLRKSPAKSLIHPSGCSTTRCVFHSCIG